MNFYTVEIPPETSDNDYIEVRCPHNHPDGHKCRRMLFRFKCKGSTSIEIRCPKCKTIIRVNVVGAKGKED